MGLVPKFAPVVPDSRAPKLLRQCYPSFDDLLLHVDWISHRMQDPHNLSTTNTRDTANLV